MKICLECGAMISPYPMHGTKYGLCEECGGDAETDSGRPKMSGKHMRIEKTPEQKKQEQVKRNVATLRNILQGRGGNR